MLVVQHDQVLYGHGFGFADRATHRVPTADTSFRVGSVTKQFTATAIRTSTRMRGSSMIAMKAVGQRAIDLAPSDDRSFYNADLDVRIRADVPPSGPVPSVSLEQHKVMMSYRR